MNFRIPTTGKTEELKNTQALAEQWESIDWHEIGQAVNRLQTRIAKAVAAGKPRKAKRLQYLLINSLSAKLFAVKKVTTNKGKRTSGMDGVLWVTSAAKMRAVLQLAEKKYRAKPLKRVYIDKKGKMTKRPLGIPTVSAYCTNTQSGFGNRNNNASIPSP